MAPPRWHLTGSTCRTLLKSMSLSFMLRPVRRRPVPRVGIVRSKTCQNGLVVRGFAVHVFHGGLGRGELFLVTKVNFRSYEHAEQTVMQSLANLQTDYLDLLLLHWPFANYYAAWRALEKLYADGRIRAIGVSNFEPDQLLDLIAYNKAVPAVNQIETNLYCQRIAERS